MKEPTCSIRNFVAGVAPPTDGFITDGCPNLLDRIPADYKFDRVDGPFRVEG